MTQPRRTQDHFGSQPVGVIGEVDHDAVHAAAIQLTAAWIRTEAPADDLLAALRAIGRIQ